MNHLYEISVGFMSSLNKGASIYYSHSLKPKDILAIMNSKKILLTILLSISKTMILQKLLTVQN